MPLATRERRIGGGALSLPETTTSNLPSCHLDGLGTVPGSFPYRYGVALGNAASQSAEASLWARCYIVQVEAARSEQDWVDEVAELTKIRVVDLGPCSHLFPDRCA
jgi:hypothetical protein